MDLFLSSGLNESVTLDACTKSSTATESNSAWKRSLTVLTHARDIFLGTASANSWQHSRAAEGRAVIDPPEGRDPGGPRSNPPNRKDFCTTPGGRENPPPFCKTIRQACGTVAYQSISQASADKPRRYSVASELLTAEPLSCGLVEMWECDFKNLLTVDYYNWT